MFNVLCRGREELHEWLNVDSFENELNKHFQILERKKYIDSQRVLYALELKDAK